MRSVFNFFFFRALNWYYLILFFMTFFAKIRWTLEETFKRSRAYTFCFSFRRLDLSNLGLGWYIYGKSGSFSFNAIYIYSSTHLLQHSLTDAQTQACTLCIHVLMFVKSTKVHEEFVKILFLYPYSSINDFYSKFYEFLFKLWINRFFWTKTWFWIEFLYELHFVLLSWLICRIESFSSKSPSILIA